MALTRALVERELIGDFGPYIAICKLNAVIQDGTNPSLEGPIREAVIAAGGTIEEWPFVTDGDIATITGSAVRFMFFARINVLEKVWGNWAHVDQKSGEEQQMLDQLAKRIKEKIAALKEELKDPEILGIDVVGPPSSGVISVGSYIQHDPLNPRFFDRFPY